MNRTVPILVVASLLEGLLLLICHAPIADCLWVRFNSMDAPFVVEERHVLTGTYRTKLFHLNGSLFAKLPSESTVVWYVSPGNTVPGLDGTWFELFVEIDLPCGDRHVYQTASGWWAPWQEP